MKEPYDLAPNDRADISTRKIFRRLFSTLQSKVDGVVDDADIEFLHDLRVANRRTRSLLSQIRSVLPAPVVETFQPEFKWLGDVTGPCRDLDVFLTALDSCRQRSGAFDPLEGFLREKRNREHGLICAALRSGRFQCLVDDWGRFLNTATDQQIRPPLASSPIIDVSGRRILKAYRRMWKRGKGIDIDPSAALLHRLRIDGKKLRYLLEFFSDLYPRSTVTRFIRELKQLQDILGDFNDTGVQLALIDEFEDCGDVSAETLAATHLLASSITERQRQLQAEFLGRFELFASEASRKLYRETFKAT